LIIQASTKGFYGTQGEEGKKGNQSEPFRNRQTEKQFLRGLSSEVENGIMRKVEWYEKKMSFSQSHYEAYS
jgi:hypothetical protein